MTPPLHSLCTFLLLPVSITCFSKFRSIFLASPDTRFLHLVQRRAMQLFYYMTKLFPPPKMCFCKFFLQPTIARPSQCTSGLYARYSLTNLRFSSHFTFVRVCRLLLFFSFPVLSDSLQPHGLQLARPPCPSPSPEVCPRFCPLHQ